MSHVPAELAWLIADQLGRVYAQWLAVSEQELLHEEITSAELIALAVLESFPTGLSQTQWGQYQGVSRQRAHILSKRLLASRFIVLKKSGRISTITLSATGRTTLERIRPGISERLAVAMTGLSRKEAGQLSMLLAKLITP